MERTLVLSRKPDESITLFVGGERIQIINTKRTTLIFRADESVRIVRTEVVDREEEDEKCPSPMA